jgi:hypothetical protein
MRDGRTCGGSLKAPRRDASTHLPIYYMSTLLKPATEPPRVTVETFTDSQHRTRFRILVDGKLFDDLRGVGFRSEEKALNYWDSNHGIPARAAERNAERRNALLAEKEERKARETDLAPKTRTGVAQFLVTFSIVQGGWSHFVGFCYFSTFWCVSIP